jgi:hypothetical protein
MQLSLGTRWCAARRLRYARGMANVQCTLGLGLLSLLVGVGCGGADLKGDCKRVSMKYAELEEQKAREASAPMPPISIRDEMIYRCMKANQGKSRRIPVACIEKATSINEANACK